MKTGGSTCGNWWIFCFSYAGRIAAHVFNITPQAKGIGVALM